MLVKPSEVKVREGLERFRKDLGNLKELADSIRIYGQIQPIVVNQAMELIAGGRRLAACSLYNMDVEVKVIDENDSLAMREIEVEENVQRQDFSPAEHVLAVKELHDIKAKLADQKGEFWSMDDTANIIKMDRSSVSKFLSMAEVIKDFPELCKCKTKSELQMSVNAIEDILAIGKPKEPFSQSVFKEHFEIVVECVDALEQEQVYNKIISLGYKCRISTY